MKSFRWRWKDREIRAQAEYVRGVLWIHSEGQTFAWDAAEEGRRGRRAGAGAEQAGDLLAPMPGKITKILKAAGEEVRRGDPILVMEAMKMEYTLKAGTDGKVGQIGCSVGQQVALGQKLAAIEGTSV